MKRRTVLAASMVFAARAGAGDAPGMPLSLSLQEELRAALGMSEPLLVMVSLEGCVHCERVRRQHLVPLRAQTRLPIVQVDMRSDHATVDFRGQRRTHDQLVRSWGVEAAPTVLFFGREGREIAPRLRGASIPDFYGAYLDDRIQTARAQLGR